MNEKLKRLLLGVGAFAALAIGGAQLAGAQGGDAAKPAATETAEQETVTGVAADKASAAALAEVGSGKVTELSSERPDAGDKADAPEAGDKADAPEAGDKADEGEQADPAYAAKVAYDVEVTKADGSATDVHLDKQFKVLGTDVADQDDDGADQNDE